MKKILSACLLACALSGAANAATIWQEDFNSYADGTTNGPAGKWIVDTSACTLDGDDHFDVQSQRMEGNDLDEEAVWMSELIPITNLVNVSIFIDIFDDAGGLEDSDYIRLYYKLDGGQETLLGTNGSNTNDFPPLTASQTNLTGNTLEVVVRMKNNATTEFISFDNIKITDASNTAPELAPISNKTVFVSGTLSFSVTATDVDNNPITLSASNLPVGAVFNSVTQAGSVTNTFAWSNISPAGVYTSTFYAADGSTNDSEMIVITVENRARIEGRFYGWDSDMIVKLDNGQFWKNIDGAGDEEDPALRNPYITVVDWLQTGTWLMSVDDGGQDQEVARIEIAEATLTNTFGGLDYENIYQLSDGTTWEQIGFETAPSETGTITVWRWTENGETLLRFLNRIDEVVGTCTAEATITPTNSTVVSAIDGTFYGWKSSRIFALENGQFWQQIDLDGSAENLLHPEVTISNWLESGIWLMSVEGAATPPSSVQVQRLTNVFHTAISGTFHGFMKGRIFKLANGSWWRQPFVESTSSVLSNPDVFLWDESGINYLEIPEAGKTIVVEELAVYLVSTITNTFTGLRYGNLYRLDGGGDWIQVSFETANTNLVDPEIMLWAEAGRTNILVRDTDDKTIGTCTVVDPDADNDGDQISNAAEIVAGTDLLDAQSVFEVSKTSRDGTGHYILHWKAIEDRIYAIDWTPSLTESFQPLETDILWPQNSWTDTVHSVEIKGFYRINVRLAD